MCIGKLAVNWWTLVGTRRLNCGYFSGLETYWMMPFMLRHELSLDSSVIIQYLFLYVITVLSHHGVFPCQLHTPLEIHPHTSATGCLLLVSVAQASLERWDPASSNA